ncbi:MAG: hypothetical protein JSV42_01630 [Chloroflexota bacterium]|nr:MAG: hypothetical protein JSV42_01630 [Chloroflexota bacterium]
MTDKEKTTPDSKCDISSCMEMIEKIMGQQMEGFDCTAMLSLLSEKDVVHNAQKIMSIMESNCRFGNED